MRQLSNLKESGVRLQRRRMSAGTSSLAARTSEYVLTRTSRLCRSSDNTEESQNLHLALHRFHMCMFYFTQHRFEGK